MKKLSVVAVVGAGGQVGIQAVALAKVREFEKVLVYDLDPSRSGRYVEEMRGSAEPACEVWWRGKLGWKGVMDKERTRDLCCVRFNRKKGKKERSIPQ